MITPLRLLAGAGIAASIVSAFYAWCLCVVAGRADQASEAYRDEQRAADALFELEYALFRFEHGD